MTRYKKEYFILNGLCVHYKQLQMYVQHIHSRQNIDNDNYGGIMGWDTLRSNLHDYVFKTIKGNISEEWSKQFDEFIDSLFICNICKKVPSDRQWYCKKCEEFVSLGDVMARLEKFAIEHPEI